MSRYVAAYDISDNRRRRQAAKTLRTFGHRVQESVFELWLEPDELQDLKFRLGMVLAQADCFDIYPIDDRGPRKPIRWMRDPDAFQPVILL